MPGGLGGPPLADGGMRIAQAGQGMGLVARPAEPSPQPQRLAQLGQGLAGAAVGEVEQAEGAQSLCLTVGIAEVPQRGQGLLESRLRFAPPVLLALQLPERVQGQGLTEPVAESAVDSQAVVQDGLGLPQAPTGPVELGQLAEQLAQV